jgi:hypothetical protein
MLSQRSRHGEHDGIRPPATTPQARGSELDIQIELLLPPAIVKELRRHAARKGVSEAVIAAMLLETIARDDLYEAVLGGK